MVVAPPCWAPHRAPAHCTTVVAGTHPGRALQGLRAPLWPAHVLTQQVSDRATDSHYINHGTCDGSGPITVEIDEGSDGDIDQTNELPSEAGPGHGVNLPFIRR
jgi:hypothetical protein